MTRTLPILTPTKEHIPYYQKAAEQMSLPFVTNDFGITITYTDSETPTAFISLSNSLIKKHATTLTADSAENHSREEVTDMIRNMFGEKEAEESKNVELKDIEQYLLKLVKRG